MKQRRFGDSCIVKTRRRSRRNYQDDKLDLDSKAYKNRRWRKYADSWVDDDNNLYAKQPRRKGKKNDRRRKARKN